MSDVLRVTGRLAEISGRLSPVWIAFVASALLSLLAIGTSDTLNRDGMLYVDAARMFLQDGFSATHQVFAWPFLPVLMATVSQITGCGLETAGHLLNIVFMASACALLVACAARLFPEAIWPTLLALLAIPGLNDYRNELLREYGCWFFVMLSFWLALRWADTPRWRTAFLVQATLAAAALFRPEALALFPALLLWQVFEAPASERWQRLAMIGMLPLLGLGALAMAYASGQLTGRLAGDLGRLSPERFADKARQVAQALPIYARDEATTILLFGSFAIIPLKFIKMMSVFCAAFLYPGLETGKFCETLKRSRIFAWATAAHLLILMIFVTDHHFLAGRYVAALLLFVVPVTGYGLWLLLQRYSRWTLPIIVASLLLALANVITLSPGKLQFVSAGRWLAQHTTESPRIYVESARSAYYAGWRFSGRSDPADRHALPEALKQGRYDLVVLEVSRKEADLGPWLEASGLREIVRFTHPNRDAVVIAEPTPRAHQDSASNTSRIREKTGSME